MYQRISLCKEKSQKYFWSNWLILFALLITATLIGCSNKQIPEQDSNLEVIDIETVKLTTKQNPDYTILPGDEIEIKFLYHPNFNTLLEVTPDGKISLPLLHGVSLLDKTPTKVALELEKAYETELKDPDIVVNVRRSTGRMIYVGGEVRAPQAINIKVPTTLWQALIRSGGMLRSAEKSNIVVIRSTPGSNAQILCVNLDNIRQGQMNDIFLQPYDVIYVPKTNIAKVGEFVEDYINNIIPKNIQLLFTYEIESDSDF